MGLHKAHVYVITHHMTTCRAVERHFWLFLPLLGCEERDWKLPAHQPALSVTSYRIEDFYCGLIGCPQFYLYPRSGQHSKQPGNNMPLEIADCSTMPSESPIILSRERSSCLRYPPSCMIPAEGLVGFQEDLNCQRNCVTKYLRRQCHRFVL